MTTKVEGSILNHEEFTTILFAILVKKLGGHIIIRQEDIDEVAYHVLTERGNPDHSIEFTFEYIERSS